MFVFHPVLLTVETLEIGRVQFLGTGQSTFITNRSVDKKDQTSVAQQQHNIYSS